MNLKLPWLIAFRYLRGRRGANAVPVLSRISMLAIAVSSGAMIVLFSVFNGFEGLVRELYSAFYPEIKVTPATGKFFATDSSQYTHICNIEGVLTVAPVLEDNVLVNSGDEQVPVTLKGVDNRYFHVNNIHDYIVDGADTFTKLTQPVAIAGRHIADQIGVSPENPFSRITLHYPNTKSANMVLNPENAFQTLELQPTGIFNIQDEFDAKYLLAPLPQVQTLFQEEGQLSAFEVKLKEGEDADVVKGRLEKLLGKPYTVETRIEQNRSLYKVMRIEKWATYAILLFVLLIASVNMIGALSLLVLEKQKDMAMLQAMGAQQRMVRLIFLGEGALWSLVGGLLGLLLGTLICMGQQRFGWIKLSGFIIDAYPVRMLWTDYIWILVTVLCVGLLAAWLPAMRAARKGVGEGLLR